MNDTHTHEHYMTTGKRDPHLAERQSDLKQNGKQEKEQFSSKAFHALQHGVVQFVGSVILASKMTGMKVFD